MYFNAYGETIVFQIPPEDFGPGWEIVVDTRISTAQVDAQLVGTQLDASTIDRHVKAGDPVPLDARSTIVLRRAD
jgi:glycogen operon protein